MSASRLPWRCFRSANFPSARRFLSSKMMPLKTTRSASNSFASKEMKGNGYYNKNSSSQKAAQDTMMPNLEAALEDIIIPTDRPFTIMDLGCSQGSNSIQPIQKIIKAVREKSEDVPIHVIHNDLPGNDFQTLFETINGRQSYMDSFENVYVSAKGQSYYDKLTPDEQVDFVLALVTLHWLPETVDFGPNAWSIRSPNVSCKSKQIAEDLASHYLKNFLLTRSKECASGAKLLLSMVSSEDQNEMPEELYHAVDEAFQKLLILNVLHPDEYAKLNLTYFPRTDQEVLNVIASPQLSEAFELNAFQRDMVVHPSNQRLMNGEISHERAAEDVVESVLAIMENALLSMFKDSSRARDFQEKFPRVLVETLLAHPDKQILNYPHTHVVLTRK